MNSSYANQIKSAQTNTSSAIITNQQRILSNNIQQVGYSPKAKIQNAPNDQSPMVSDSQRQIISQKVIQFNNASGSQSPETELPGSNSHVQTAAGGIPQRKPSGTVMQRIQLKNVAFIPGKAPQQQSPQSISQASNIAYGEQQIGIAVTKQATNNSGQPQQQQIITTGQKMIIPAHQIKIVKKDGTSPSPEARGFFSLKQSSPNQVTNNSGISGYQTQTVGQQQPPFTIQKISNRMAAGSGPTPTKHPQSLLVQPNAKPAPINNQQISDDEATVRSDSEGDKPKTIQNPSNLISNSKVNGAKQHGHHSTTLTNSSHHSHSSNGGSVASVHTHPGTTSSHHSHHHVSHHNSNQSSQSNTGNNFNRPKMSSTQQSQNNQYPMNPSQQTQLLGSNANDSQKQPSLMRGIGSTTENNNRGIKIISQNKIRQSPSPPPNLVINSQAPPSVTNIQIQMKQQQQIQISQQNVPQTNNTGSQQLATDFIKGMINQNRQGGVGGGTSGVLGGQKKLGSGIQMLNSSAANTSQGLSGCLKIKNTAITQPPGAIPVGTNSQVVPNGQPSFVKDMKKHGLIKDIQDVNQSMHSNLTAQGPNENHEPQKGHHQQVPSISQKILHLRNYSPPPIFNPSEPANIQMVKENHIQKQNAYINAQQNTSSDYQDQNATGDSQTNNAASNAQASGGVFQFPFQRRARSLSIPKQDAAIQIKLKQATQATNVVPGIGTEGPGAAGVTVNGQPQLQSKSPSPTGEDSRRNRPVVAKINFVIAQKGALGANYRGPDDESIFERNKEVDEWLMGSGESDATAGSNNDKSKQVIGPPQAVHKRNPSQQSQTKAKQNELERPVQPGIIGNNIPSSDEEDGCEDDEDDWMFQTFTGGKKGKGQKPISGSNQIEDSRINPHHLHNGGSNDLDGGLGSSYEENSNSSPFDLPADIMTKQFTKLGANAGSVPQQSLHFGYPHHLHQHHHNVQHQTATATAATKPMVDILMEEDDCSKDLSSYINSIDELMGKMF